MKMYQIIRLKFYLVISICIYLNLYNNNINYQIITQHEQDIPVAYVNSVTREKLTPCESLLHAL